MGIGTASLLPSGRVLAACAVAWGCLAIPGPVPQDGAPAIDLQHIHSNPWPIDKRKPLHLAVAARVVGPHRLTVRVTVSNWSDAVRRVPPITPQAYVVEFRDARGRQVDMLPHLQFGDPRLQVRSELPALWPGNALSAVFLWSDTRRTGTGAAAARFRVRCWPAGIGLTDDSGEWGMDSGWLALPKPSSAAQS